MSKSFRSSAPFPEASAHTLEDAQLRANLRRATGTIRQKRGRVLAELDDLEELRDTAAAIQDEALSHLDELLAQVEQRVSAAGGHVHFATDAGEARSVLVDLVKATGATEVVKVKSMTTMEIELNDALVSAGVRPVETDLAELIVQLGDDLPSHIVVPAIHRNRSEVRDIFSRRMGESGLPAPAGLGDSPEELAAAARAHLRRRFLEAEVAVSGANFVVAETGSVAVVESEGNGRMCLTLPRTLITVAGIDKLVPRFADLEVFLQLLARSATGERLSPYTSVWTGATPGNGPSEFHLVLVDNGRSRALADRVGRQALRCIRCAACLNACPVYERAGGHAYGSVYPGPIGAVLTPQLDGVATGPVEAALPFASTLCGACADVCPVRIDIPRLLVHLRGRVVDEHRGANAEGIGMAVAAYAMSAPGRFSAVGRLAAVAGKMVGKGRFLAGLPGPAGRWAGARDLPALPRESFRQWWASEHAGGAGRAYETEPGPAAASPALRAVSVRDVVRWLRPSAGRPTRPSVPVRSAGGREAVMAAVADALRQAPFEPVEVPRRYKRDGAAPGENGLLEQFIQRVQEYRATARAVGATDVGEAVAAALGSGGSRRVVVPADIPQEWLPAAAGDELEVVADDGELSAADLDVFDATVSGCAVAVASTGTVVLDSGVAQGRRILSLVPDHLVVVVRADQVVGTVPEAVDRLVPTASQTWISGPSATSDIELQRVEGVHGPRKLDIVVVRPNDTGPPGPGGS